MGRHLPSTFGAKYLKKPEEADPGSFVKLLGEGTLVACTFLERGVTPKVHRPDGRNDNRNFEFLLLSKESIDVNVKVRWIRGTLRTNFQFHYPKLEVVLPKFFCLAGRPAWVLPILKILKGSGKKQGRNKSSNL